MTLYYGTSSNAVQKTLDAALNSGVTASATLNNVTGIQNKKGVFVVDRVDTNGVLTPNKREYIGFTGTSGSTVVTLTRNIDGGGSDQDHAVGAIVEFGPDAVWADGVMDALDNLVDSTGTPKLTVGSDATGDLYYRSSTPSLARLGIGTTGQALIVSGGLPAWGAAGAAFWTDVPGTPTRVSDTQFTITDTSNANGYDTLFKKGVILKWLESSTFQTAMVISSSYGTNTVTINIVGDSLTAGFTSMKYAGIEAACETFIIPGTIAAGTDLAKTWYVPEQCYIISTDSYVKTAGTTNSTVFDINDDGSTKFTTKPTITTGTTSDIDNVADNPSTAVAKDSLITIDVDSVSTTAPVEAYIKVFWYPIEWTKR